MTEHRLSAEVWIERPLAEVRAFFRDPHSLVRWDRSVAKVVVDGPETPEVGATFTTIGPARGGREGTRTHYRVRSIDGDVSTVELRGSDVFESAVWAVALAPEGGGTRVTCGVDLRMRPRYALLGWLLRLNRRALDEDLFFLKRALEHGEVAKR